jgi:V8-like Glu-specific endopeptidase
MICAVFGLALQPTAAAGTPSASANDQVSDVDYWTPERMSVAIPDDGGRAPVGKSASALAVTAPPPGTPTGQLFGGIPMVGSFFYEATSGGKLANEFCSGSVVQSPGHDLVLTAGHCGKTLQTATHRIFVPQFRAAETLTGQPNGAFGFTQQDVFVDPRYTANSKKDDSDLDFAFVRVGPDMVAGPKNGKKIEDLTGGLTLTSTPDYSNGGVLVVGYPENAGFNPKHQAVRCTVPTGKLTGFNQMLMYCRGYYGGVSGGPWILNYNAAKHTGQVIGNVGGYHGGGDDEDHDWVTYSPMYTNETTALYDDAVAHRTPARSGAYQTPAAAKADSLHHKGHFGA